MIVGVTATRNGLTRAQWSGGRSVLSALGITELHHGCCLGGDEDFAEMIETNYGSIVQQVGHPSNLKAQTSAKAVACCCELHDAKPPLERNHDIVDAVEVMVAAPATMAEQQRSGTWATIRYGRKVGRRIIIIWPDGTTTQEP